jgi:hypothetical protein
MDEDQFLRVCAERDAWQEKYTELRSAVEMAAAIVADVNPGLLLRLASEADRREDEPAVDVA